MPKKLKRCVRKVQGKGHSKSSAYGICVSSTGIKRKKGGGWTKGKKTKKK
jgi:hypothetical protein